MLHTGRILTLLLAVMLVAGCASWGKELPPAPTIDEIVQMAQSGVPADEVIRRMEESQAVYRLPASELAKLGERGVPDQVLDYMQQTYIADERWRAYLRSRDMYMGWYSWPYYYPGPWAYRTPFWGPPFW